MCRCRTWLRFPKSKRRGRFEYALNQIIYWVEYVRQTNSLFSFGCVCFHADQRRRLAGRCRNLCEEWRCCSVKRQTEYWRIASGPVAACERVGAFHVGKRAAEYGAAVSCGHSVRFARGTSRRWTTNCTRFWPMRARRTSDLRTSFVFPFWCWAQSDACCLYGPAKLFGWQPFATQMASLFCL